jgi:hypothetical protein
MFRTDGGARRKNGERKGKGRMRKGSEMNGDRERDRIRKERE